MDAAATEPVAFRWRDYARIRARAVVAGAAFAFVGTCAARSIPDRSEEAVASVLGEAIGGRVDPHDFVWEPSRGFWTDAFIGRRVLFLGRKGAADSPRALYRACVTVTRGGRPLRVRATAALTNTDLADEDGLVVDGERAAVAAVALERTQSVEWLELASTNAPRRGLRSRLREAMWGGIAAPVEARRVSFERPPTRAHYEFQGNELVLGFDPAGQATLDAAGHISVDESDSTGAFAAASERLLPNCIDSSAWSWVRSRLGRPTKAAMPAATSTSHVVGIAPPSIDYAFPPSAAFHQIEGLAGVYRMEEDIGAAHVTLTAFDMRTLSPRLAVGTESPVTRTGHISSGAAPDAANAAGVIAVPAPKTGGAWDHGIVVAPLAPHLFTLFEAGGALSVGEGTAISPPRGSAVQWSDNEGSANEARALLCITAGGHLIHAWSPSAVPEDLRAAVKDFQCVATSPASPIEVGNGPTGFDPTISKNGALYLMENAVKAPIEPPEGGKWVVSSSPQPDPTSIAAVYETSIEKMGSTVRIHLFMPHRFEWLIRAGDDEKSHRFGGHFESELTEDDKGRAFFAISLGIGKRHSPNGLRIAGSTGHAFHEHLGLLETNTDDIRLYSSGGAEPEGDATELPLTVEARELTTEARIRGPKQLLGDLCVLGDGSVLVADAEFENHEGTASALADLGCPLAVALDRGADRPTEVQDRTSASLPKRHPMTQLFALKRPFAGSVDTIRP